MGTKVRELKSKSPFARPAVRHGSGSRRKQRGHRLWVVNWKDHQGRLRTETFVDCQLAHERCGQLMLEGVWYELKGE